MLVECVPNFSEGRNAATIDLIADVVKSISGLALLDRQSDEDHNRSVLTFIGPPALVGMAAFLLAKTSRELIDLSLHHGVHPRVGATDVIPFVPLKSSDIDECILLAKSVGARIADELDIPVFLYERATKKRSRSLEDIRRGSLPGLTCRMKNESNWEPDFGLPAPHPTAGVTMVGVRPILVAFNVNLSTDNLSIAKIISQNIRESGGGFKCLKAMGVRLESRGMVQVSMNFTNLDHTPIHVVFEAIKLQATSFGVTIAGSEIVGLIPENSMKNCSGNELKLECFTDEQILERRLLSFHNEQ